MIDADALFDLIRSIKQTGAVSQSGRLTQSEVDAVNTVLNKARATPVAASPLAWGASVSPAFRDKVRLISSRLGCDPNDLMACMAWESGRSFSPSKKNMAGSGATGLIQFMPTTAVGLGITVQALAAMSAEQQLDWVEKYFKPFKGKLGTLADLYMAILWPKAVGQPLEYVLWDKAKMPTTFRQNAGLDTNKDGLVTKAECSAKLYAMKAEGMKPENVA